MGGVLYYTKNPVARKRTIESIKLIHTNLYKYSHQFSWAILVFTNQWFALYVCRYVHIQFSIYWRVHVLHPNFLQPEVLVLHRSFLWQKEQAVVPYNSLVNLVVMILINVSATYIPPKIRIKNWALYNPEKLHSLLV